MLGPRCTQPTATTCIESDYMNKQLWKITLSDTTGEEEDCCIYVTGHTIDEAADNGREAIRDPGNDRFFVNPNDWRIRGAYNMGELELSAEDNEEDGVQ